MNMHGKRNVSQYSANFLLSLVLFLNIFTLSLATITMHDVGVKCCGDASLRE